MNVRNQRTQQNPIKRFIKRCLQHTAAAFGPHKRSSKEPQLIILMYHRILPASDSRAQFEEPGMMVTPDTFRMHLESVRQYFEIIDLSDWINRKHSGDPLPEKACAITFDDGWSDNYEYAYPILKELEVPATIFLVSDMIGTTLSFWPERLSSLMTTIATRYPQLWNHPDLTWLQPEDCYQFNHSPPNSEEISALIGKLKRYSDHQMHERLTDIENNLRIDTNDDPVSLLDWQQVEEMQASNLLRFGSHTRQHTRLNDDISTELMSDEIINSKQQIEQQIGETVTTFCYPNGDHCPESIALVTRNYKAAVTTKSGWNTADTDPHLLHRIGIHQDAAADRTAFLARISGWF